MCSSMPLTLVIVAVVFARHTLADPGDDFSNNLFSDLAPILALFGERVTMQFMSESLGIADCIILAMAPVGIITIIVGAIRVGGPQWLKAIIGRARENLSEAEKEIMSSTSQEVCELYNGKSIIRCQGAPVVWEYICLFTPREGHQDDVPNIEVLTFKEAVERKLLVDGKDKMGWREFYRSLKEFAHRWRRFYQNTKTNARRFRDRVSRKNKEKSPGQDSPDLEAPNEDAFTQSQPTPPLQPSEQPKVGWDIKVIRDVTPDAPNLSLNRHDQISRVGVHIVAAFATALQSGVLIFFGFITYSPRLQPNFRKGDQAVAGYACPMAAGGTVFLVLGLFICACIVENKTEEKHWRPSDNATMQVTWLQQAQTVGDQVFKAFATYPKTPRIVFSTSRKSVSSQHETLSTFGVGFALVGFVSQFIGLRGMNWAASVAQLVAALIMVAARAWLRRGLAQPLVAKELTSQFELDWLAMTLANVEDHAGPWRQFLKLGSERGEHIRSNMEASGGVKKGRNFRNTWTIETGLSPKYLPLSAESSARTRAQTVLAARRELGEVARFPGPVSDVALRLTKTIETVANILLPSQFKKELALNWTVEVMDVQERSVEVSLHLSRLTRTSPWKASVGEIASVISLWAYSSEGLGRSEKNTDHHKNARLDKRDDSWLRGEGPQSTLGLRILAPRKQHILQELRWWMPDSLDDLLAIKQPTEAARGGQASREQPDLHEGNRTRDGLTETVGITEQTVENNAIETIEVDRGRIVGYGLRREIIHDDENYRKDTHFESEKMKTNVDVLDFSAEDERLRLKESYRAPYDSRFRYTWHLNQDEEGKEEESKIFLAIKTFDGIIKLYAKDLLYAFISSVAKSLATSIQGNTETRPMEKYAIKNWKSIMLWNRNVARLAQEVQNNIFGTSFEAYLSVLAPLSMEGKLPEPEAVFDIALEKASQDRRDRGLLKAADAHLWLWMQVKRFSCAEGQVFTRGLAYLVEYINDVHEQGRLSKEDNNWTLQDTLYKLEEKMIKEIAATTASQKALARLARLYKDQGRPWAEDLTKRMNLPASNHNSIEALGGLGMTETHQMLLNGADDEWPYLVAEKPSMNRKDVSGWTPLHYLMAKGKKDLLRSLSPGWNPDALDILDINAKDWRGWTPLHYACLHGHFSAIYWFADLPQANLSAQGTDGVTPLHCAAKNGHVYVAEKLIWTLDRKHLVVFGGDADMHPRTLRDYDNGRAAIHWAVVAGHEKMTQLLEADSNLKDRKGWTALHLAIVHGKTDICKLLMRRGSLEALDDRGRTPLLLATEYERWEIAQELVKLEADVNARGPFGWTPLHWVAHARTDANLGLGELLLNKGARVDVANRDGMTPFHLGSESGKLKFLERLLDRGPENIIHAHDDKKDTPLYLSLRRNDPEVTKLLIEKGAQVTGVSPNGKSPLHVALTESEGAVNQETIKMLIAAGADLNAKDKDGLTPFQIAEKNSLTSEIVEMLKVKRT